MKLNVFLALLLLVVMGCGCSKNNQKVDVLTIDGKVIYEGEPASDGCGWLVKTVKNDFFVIENMQEEFKVNNLSVKITYTKKNEIFVCAWGKKYEIITVVDIKPI